jgi:SPP1 family holin
MKPEIKREIKTDTIIRTICLALALINQLLSAFGKSPLPIKDEQVEVLVTTTVTVAAATWAWWKNNSFTQAALAGDAHMHALKGRKDAEDSE